MKLNQIKNYLNEKITNSWYKNSEIDYGITGKFIDAQAIGDDLKIIWEEMGERLEMVVGWFTEYTAEQIYNIWMEGCSLRRNAAEAGSKPGQMQRTEK